MQNYGRPVKNQKRVCVRFVILWFVIFMVGCESIATTILKEPEVNVVGFRVIEANFMEQQFGVKIKIDNPNVISLPIKRVDYTFDIAGKEFVNGSTNKPFRVPAHGSETFEVEVNLNIFESASYLSAIIGAGSEKLDYKLEGTVDVDMPMMGTIPITKKGQIKLTR